MRYIIDQTNDNKIVRICLSTTSSVRAMMDLCTQRERNKQMFIDAGAMIPKTLNKTFAIVEGNSTWPIGTKLNDNDFTYIIDEHGN